VIYRWLFFICLMAGAAVAADKPNAVVILPDDLGYGTVE
jgi:hypothetical protein